MPATVIIIHCNPVIFLMDSATDAKESGLHFFENRILRFIFGALVPQILRNRMISKGNE